MVPSSASPLYAAVKQVIHLRYYQRELADEARRLWDQGIKNLMLVLPTGGGKTVTFGDLISKHQGASCAIAHRQELVSQISLALARVGVRHKIIGSDDLIKSISRLHVEGVGCNFIFAGAPVAVAGVDTLIRKGKLVSESWLRQVTLVVHDEGHHLLRKNKWGKATDLFANQNRRLLSVTATPTRADGAGLGKDADGFIEHMIMGPSPRRLIDEGYLTDYRVVLAKSDVELVEQHFSKATGELNGAGKALVRGSHIVGNAVDSYIAHANGKRAIVFAPDVEMSIAMAEQFRRAGIRALHIDGETETDVRDDAVRKLKRQELDVLCNVGLFGEGFDLPAIEAVIDASATESYSSYAQRFGRMLRLSIAPELMAQWENYSPSQRLACIAASSKPFGLYVDLVGNMLRHKGPPDQAREWTLDAREKRSSAKGVELITTCTNPVDPATGYACGKNYERYLSRCPYCGFKPEPTARNSPEFVDGDFTVMDAAAVAELFSRIVDTSAPFVPPQHVDAIIGMANARKHRELIAAQTNLREAFAWWAGEHRARGLLDSEIYRLFYLTFGVDWLSACAYRKADADLLAEKIDSHLTGASLHTRIRPESYQLT